MRLICPNCNAQYEVDAALIPEDGRDVQCSDCGHTWFQPKDGPARPAASADVSAGAEASKSRPAPASETGAPPAEWGDTLPETGSGAMAGPASDMSAEGPTGGPSATRRKRDEMALSILREEAQREAAARRREAGSLETQGDLGLNDLPLRDGGGSEAAESALGRARAKADRLNANQTPDTPRQDDEAPRPADPDPFDPADEAPGFGPAAPVPSAPVPSSSVPAASVSSASTSAASPDAGDHAAPAHDWPPQAPEGPDVQAAGPAGDFAPADPTPSDAPGSHAGPSASAPTAETDPSDPPAPSRPVPARPTTPRPGAGAADGSALDDGAPRPLLPAEAPDRHSTDPEAPEEATETGSRRDLLPDIEEINSTLTPSGERRPQADPETDVAGRETRSRRGFRMGFSLIVLIVAALLLVYTYAPLLADRFPGWSEPISLYVTWANGIRTAVEGVLVRAGTFLTALAE